MVFRQGNQVNFLRTKLDACTWAGEVFSLSSLIAGFTLTIHLLSGAQRSRSLFQILPGRSLIQLPTNFFPLINCDTTRVLTFISIFHSHYLLQLQQSSKNNYHEPSRACLQGWNPPVSKGIPKNVPLGRYSNSIHILPYRSSKLLLRG